MIWAREGSSAWSWWEGGLVTDVFIVVSKTSLREIAVGSKT